MRKKDPGALPGFFLPTTKEESPFNFIFPLRTVLFEKSGIEILASTNIFLYAR
jgi:hypothetical protein